MGKRTVFEDADENQVLARKKAKSSKHSKVDNETRSISSWEELRRLLIFQQDDASILRQNINAFKNFLDAIAYGKDETDRLQKQSILLAFLKSELPKDEDKSAVYLSNIIQTWRFAVNSNIDSLLSALPAVLALLLKTISSLIDFRDYGIQLCRTLLQNDQVMLLDRGLTANQAKEFLISPCLRLLTEIVSFDGGSMARRLYQQREYTFKRLDTFLNSPKRSAQPNSEAARKPTVRSNALRYLLANFRYQDQAVKTDILSQFRLIRAIFKDLKQDNPEVILHLIDSIKKSILLDKSLPTSAKKLLFTEWTLARTCELYEHQEDGGLAQDGESVRESAHALLLLACTDKENGILIAQHGWYPPCTEFDTDFSDIRPSNHLSIALIDDLQDDEYKDKVPVYNTTVANFLQGLRPYASIKQKALTIAIFDAAPELVADYFLKKKTFSFEPKLSATWIGYSAFLFSVIQLPLPVIEFRKSPPPVSIVIESIIPRPLTRKALTRCFTQNDTLITFFAARLLIIGFQKLQASLSALEPPVPTVDWEHARLKLAAEFSRRCPDLKPVILAFRSCSKENDMLREALTQLLKMYYDHVPQLALDQKFDCSLALLNALNHTSASLEGSGGIDMRLLELDNLFEIAYRSSEMRWWQKPEGMPLSPFTSILQLQSTAKGASRQNIRRLLHSINEDHGIFQGQTSIPGIDATIFSLQLNERWSTCIALYDYLENCLSRFIRKSIKYFCDFSDFSKINPSPDQGPVSLFIFVMLEQWPFLIESAQHSELETITSWISHLFEILELIGEDKNVLGRIRDQMMEQLGERSCRSSLQQSMTGTHNVELLKMMEDQMPSLAREAGDIISKQRKQIQGDGELEPLVLPAAPPEEPEDHPEFAQYTREDLTERIENGTVGKIILCLCSEREDIRKQASSILQLIAAQFKESDYKESQQIYMLLCEILETARIQIAKNPLPYVVGSLGQKSLLVLIDPLHVMYTKINQFLNRSPQWDTDKLPSYWIDKVFLHEPTDTAHYEEVEWTIDAFINGLRTSDDMDLYRRCNVFERLMSFSSSRLVSRHCEDKVMELLYRCTFVDGSTTLVTRCAILGWIEACKADSRMNPRFLEALALRVIATADKGRLHEWTNGVGISLHGENNQLVSS